MFHNVLRFFGPLVKLRKFRIARGKLCQLYGRAGLAVFLDCLCGDLLERTGDFGFRLKLSVIGDVSGCIGKQCFKNSAGGYVASGVRWMRTILTQQANAGFCFVCI